MNKLVMYYEPFLKYQKCVIIRDMEEGQQTTEFTLTAQELEKFIREHQYLDQVTICNSKMFNKKKLTNFDKTNVKITYL